MRKSANSAHMLLYGLVKEYNIIIFQKLLILLAVLHKLTQVVANGVWLICQLKMKVTHLVNKYIIHHVHLLLYTGKNGKVRYIPRLLL